MQRWLTVAVAWVGLAAAAFAAPQSAYDDAMAPCAAGLKRQCADRHLDLLSPASLRDVLDDFKDSLPKSQSAHMDAAETTGCTHTIAGATCFNVRDIEAANALKLTPRIALRVCSSFTTCREQPECEAAPAAGQTP